MTSILYERRMILMGYRVIRNLSFVMILAAISLSSSWADTVILRNGASYTGQFTGAPGGTIGFTDGQGIKYKFPIHDVQTLVFTNSNDTVTLRDGRSYSGRFTGGGTIKFQDAAGVKYQFPLSDVASLVLSSSQIPVKRLPTPVKVIPAGTEISVRTNETIDSRNAAPGQTFRGEIRQSVLDSSGVVAIPKGSPAELMVHKVSGGGLMHSPEVVLDLAAVTVNGKAYRVVTSDEYESSNRGIGKNKRTAELLGGGAAIGALMGAIFGGGKGAAIGALTGAGGGGVTQVLTRGKQVSVPAETVLMFRLEKTLILEPK
jgi:hypothetical protein